MRIDAGTIVQTCADTVTAWDPGSGIRFLMPEKMFHLHDAHEVCIMRNISWGQKTF